MLGSFGYAGGHSSLAAHRTHHYYLWGCHATLFLTAAYWHLAILLQSVVELEAARGELSSQAAMAAGEVSRLSIALQDMDHQRAGLARKLNV